MIDLTLIGLTTLAGYFFNKDGRNPRAANNIRSETGKVDKPNGDNIYTSNVVDEANAEILNKSLQNYKNAERASETGYIPPLFNTYSVVGNKDAFNQTMELSSVKLGELNDINRLVNVLENKQTSGQVEERPMFKSFGYTNANDNVNVGYELGKQDNKGVNLLTGKQYETTHANMVPFFGSNVKQNMENFANESLLDSRTGNTSTYKNKKEIASLYDTKPQNIYGNPVFTTQVETDRYIPSLYRQNERPVEPERIAAPIAGTFENNIRPSYKDVNELRPGNKPKETYKSRILSGKMGEERGISGKVSKNRPDTFFENEHRFAGPGEYVAPKIREDYSKNMKSSSRQDYNTEYYGGQFNASLVESKQRLTNVDNSDELSSYFQDPKRHNFENDYLRNMSGTTLKTHSDSDYGKSGFNIPESERASTSERTHLLNATIKTGGVKLRLQDNAKTTLKESTIKTDNIGNVNNVITVSSNSPYYVGMSSVTAKTTNKETFVDNKYKGLAHKNSGMGYVVNKYDAKTTGKEILTDLGKNYISNPKFTSESESRDRFNNTVIRDAKQESLMGSRASGPQNFQVSSGKTSYGDIKLTGNMLMKEQENVRDKTTHNYVIATGKDQIGMIVKYRDDNEKVDKINRLQPELLETQLQSNPYAIDTSKMI